MVLTPLFSAQSQKARGRGSNSLRDDDDELSDQLDFSKIGSETVSPTIRRRKSPVSSSSSDSYNGGYIVDDTNNISTCPSGSSSGSSEYNAMGSILEKYDHHPETASPLHAILKDAKTVDDLEPAIPLISATSACYADAFGRTALHIFAENTDLSHSSAQNHLSISPTSTTAGSSPLDIPPSLSARSGSIGSNITFPQQQTGEETEALIKFVVNHLWPAYHASLMTTDKKGCIPFEEAIRDWVDSVYDKCSRRSASGRTSAFTSVAPQSKATVPSMLDINNTIRWKNTAQSVLDKDNQISISSQDGNNIETVARGNGDVESGPRSSRVMETYRDKLFPERVRMEGHALYSLQMLSSLLDVMVAVTDAATIQPRRRNKNRKRTMQENLRTTTLKDMRDAIVHTVASIPDFVKLVLIIDDDEQREQILGLTLLKYVLINKASVGTWLTGMLQSKSRVMTDIAISYLRLVSTVTICNEEDEQDQTIVIGKIKEEMELRDEFYQEASRLEDFVPSLLSLGGDEQIEEAATTTVVQQVLDRIISRPFAVTIVFCDAMFLALFIFGFRGAVNRALLGGSASVILTYVHLANMGIFYFLIRETGKGISLCMVTRKARTYFVSFWNLIDLGTIILGLVSTLAIRSQSFDGLRNLCAITTGLLWLRVLSYLKGINMQLATFVLAILQITRDILWFCVILCIVVVLFSQMFFTLLAPDTCSSSDMRGDKECSQNEYYLKVYAILLGDFGLFGRDNFASVFSVVLIVLYTFFVVLVLLNVLIAVASDSYEKCLLRSQNLFGRARVMMIAELVSFQQLLRRSSQQGVTSSSTSDLGLLSNSWWSSESWLNGWSHGSLVFFSLSFLIFLTWTLGELAGYFAGPRLGNAWLSFGSIFVNVGLYVGVMFFLASGATDRSNMKDGDDDSQSPTFFFRWYGQYFQQMMVRVLGSSGGSSAQGDDLWKGRLVFLQSEMSKMAKETKIGCKELLRGVEKSVVHSETQLRNEVSSLERSLATFIEEQRQTNVRINALIDKRRL